MANKFRVEIVGDGFTLSMQGSGDEAAAKKYLTELYRGCKIKIISFGEPVSMEGG